MRIAPTSAASVEPRPPAMLVPPITTARDHLELEAAPVSVVTLPTRPTRIVAARPTSAPVSTNARSRSPLTSSPAKRAALRLPPTA